MSGGVSLGLITGAVLGGIGVFIVAPVAGIFALVHATKLISAGDSTYGNVYLGVGGLLTLPLIFLIGFGIWKLGRQAFAALGKSEQ